MKAGFFKIYKQDKTIKSYQECLLDLQAIFDADGRYINSNNKQLCMSNIETDGDFVSGDIYLRQTSDLPPHALDNQPITENTTPHVHRTAFLFNNNHSTIALQRGINTVSVQRINRLIQDKCAGARFEAESLITPEAIEHITSKNIRKFQIRIAEPSQSSIEGDQSNLANLQQMRAMFDAPYIEVTSGFDSRKQGLLNGSKILQFVRKAQTHSQVQRVRLQEEGATDMLDLMGQKLSYTSLVDTTDCSLSTNYNKRKQFLKDAYESRCNFITENYCSN